MQELQILLTELENSPEVLNGQSISLNHTEETANNCTTQMKT